MNISHGPSGRLQKAAPSGIIRGSMLDPPRNPLSEILGAFRELVVEGGERDNMRDLLSRFRRALLEHETALDRSKAAREFGQAIDRLIADIQLGRAMKSSLSKGYAPQDFFRR
jgi:hypothetical protein